MVKNSLNLHLSLFPPFVLKPINLSQKWIVCRGRLLYTGSVAKEKITLWRFYLLYLCRFWRRYLVCLCFFYMTLDLMKILFPSACMHSQSCPTLYSAVDCSLPCSSVHGTLPARMLQWVAICYPQEVFRARVEPESPALHVDASPLSLSEAQGLSLLTRIKWNESQFNTFSRILLLTSRGIRPLSNTVILLDFIVCSCEMLHWGWLLEYSV